MNIREISITKLKAYENNPRNNDLAVEKVKYSIKRFGFLFPIVIDINFIIVCGHTRVRACQELGIGTVPCIIADELTEEQINLFRLIDNKTSEYSDWDFEKLKNEMALIDLTIDENQLLLEQFELTAEVFDLDSQMAEIKVPTLNFISSDKNLTEKKSVVSTIQTGELVADNINSPKRESQSVNEIKSLEQLSESGQSEKNTVEVNDSSGIEKKKLSAWMIHQILIIKRMPI